MLVASTSVSGFNCATPAASLFANAAIAASRVGSSPRVGVRSLWCPKASVHRTSSPYRRRSDRSAVGPRCRKSVQRLSEPPRYLPSWQSVDHRTAAAYACRSGGENG